MVKIERCERLLFEFTPIQKIFRDHPQNTAALAENGWTSETYFLHQSELYLLKLVDVGGRTYDLMCLKLAREK